MNYLSTKTQKQSCLLKQIDLAAKAIEADRKGKVCIPVVTAPLEVALPYSDEKATSYVKEQAFPDRVIDAAIEAFKRHGKKVLIVTADNNYLPHSDVIGNVICKVLGRNFTSEEQNDADHYAQCLGNLVASSPGYAGVLQKVYEAGAIEFALDKVLNDYGGEWGDLNEAVSQQTARPGYAMTIYSNSWGVDIRSPAALENVKLAAGPMMNAFDKFEADQGGVAHFFSAGNAGNASDMVGVDVEGFPARLAYPISVGAITEKFYHAVFTSPGTSVDCALGGQATLSVTKDGRPAVWSGTSSSCPYAAGLAALLFLIDPEKYNTQDALRSALRVSSLDINKLPATPGRDNFTGYGMPQLINLLPTGPQEPVREPQEPIENPEVAGPAYYNLHLRNVTATTEAGVDVTFKSLIAEGTIIQR